MRVLRMFVVGCGAALALGTAALPAQAAAPSPQGCTFDQSVGQTTCVTTVTSTRTVGPFTGSGLSSDGSVPGQSCLSLDTVYAYYSARGARSTAATVTTTTQVYQGRSPGNGNKVSSNQTSTTSYTFLNGDYTCSTAPLS